MPDQLNIPAPPPPWVRTVSGTHPLLDLEKHPVTEKEIEVSKRRTEERMKDWRGHHTRDIMTVHDQFLAEREDRRGLHQANVECFQADLDRVQDGESDEFHAARQKHATEQIAQHKMHLAHALKDLGRFDEAIATVEGVDSFMADFVRKQAAGWKAAVEKDDDDDCDCLTPVLETDDATGTPVTLQGIKHHSIGLVFSPKHDRVVDIWSCPNGHLNAHPNEHPKHMELRHKRSAAFKVALAQQAKGLGPVPDPNKADHLHLEHID